MHTAKQPARVAAAALRARGGARPRGPARGRPRGAAPPRRVDGAGSERALTREPHAVGPREDEVLDGGLRDARPAGGLPRGSRGDALRAVSRGALAARRRRRST